MLAIAILLLILGFVGIIMASFMFGDIGIAAGIGAMTAILAGIGFLIAHRRLPKA
jgi:positive regulator of sigma E activity